MTCTNYFSFALAIHTTVETSSKNSLISAKNLHPVEIMRVSLGHVSYAWLGMLPKQGPDILIEKVGFLYTHFIYIYIYIHVYIKSCTEKQRQYTHFAYAYCSQLAALPSVSDICHQDSYRLGISSYEVLKKPEGLQDEFSGVTALEQRLQLYITVLQFQDLR